MFVCVWNETSRDIWDSAFEYMTSVYGLHQVIINYVHEHLIVFDGVVRFLQNSEREKTIC